MLNKVQLIGFTGAEPDGERQDYTTWHTVEIWNAGTVKWLDAKGLAKGSKVFIEGEIRHDRYTDGQGVERYFSKVLVATAAHEVKSLDRPGDNEDRDED